MEITSEELDWEHAGVHEPIEQDPKEEVEDAYAAHVRALHERDDAEKMATLILPEKHMTAVALLITDCLDDQKERNPLTAEQQRTWESIVRSFVKAIREAE